MTTRIVFFAIAAFFIGAAVWAYHHDERLQHNIGMVNIGDPNETVRELVGRPSSEGGCGGVTLAPSRCATEYVYRYYYSIFRPQYEVVWFDASGKVLGLQHVQRP